MAEAYSAWSVNYANYRMRGYVNAWISRSNDDNVWITVAGHAYFDSAYQYGIAGQVGHSAAGRNAEWSGDINWACLSPFTNGAYGQVEYGPFPRQANDYNVYCWYKTWGKTVNGYGGWRWGSTEAGVNVTVPHIPYYKPHKPKNFSASRINDSSQKLAWSPDYTGMDGHYPWAGVYIDRRTDDGNWVNIKDVSWDVTGYTDNSTSAGHKYGYRLCAHGPGGNSDHTNELILFTTPSKFEYSTSKNDDGSVGFTVVSAPRYYESIESQLSTDGKTWKDVSLTKTGKGFEDPSPPAGTVYYRIRAVQSGLKGPWTESGAVITICPPKAPSLTGLAPVYATGDGSTGVTFAIVPNHPDRTSPSAQEVEITLPDGTSSTYSVAPDQSVFSRSFQTKGTYKVRARTKGLDPSWGEWSRYYVFRIADAPQAYFTTPANDQTILGDLPLNAAWTIADETGVSYLRIALVDDAGNEVASDVLETTARTWQTGQYSTIKNGSAYTLVLDVTGGSGLTVRAERKFTTHWLEPAPPKITISYDSELSASVKVEAGETEYAVSGTTLTGPMSIVEGGIALGGNTVVSDGSINLTSTAVATEFDISRLNPDGTLTRLASKISSGEAALDRLPPLNVGFHYVVVAYARSGTSIEVSVPTRCRSRFAALNFGKDASTFLRGGYNPTFENGYSHTRELYHFADGGENEGLPMRYDLDDTDINGSASWDLKSVDEAQEVRKLARKWSWCWFRDLDGNRATVAIDMTVSRKSSGTKVWSVSASMDETIWEEPVNGDIL